MQGQNYKKILDAMQDMGIYVIREDDHRILYFNRRVQATTPEARLGMVCHDLWSESCPNCPLLTIGSRQESRSVSYNSPFGRVVDITASRIVWEEDIPAFVITLTPHMEVSSYIYHRLIRADLSLDSYEVVRLGQDDEDWARGREEPLSAWLERSIWFGRLHPEDVERFRSFTKLDHLRTSLRSGKKVLTCTYRRWINGSFHWNLLEVVPDTGYTDEHQLVLLYAKDVHDVLREGLEREESNIRRQEIIGALGEQNFSIYVIDLDTGLVDPIRIEGQMQRIDGNRLMDWETELQPQLQAQLHWEYQEHFRQMFSLANLRRTRGALEPRVELLCQRTTDGELFNYISINACFNHEREHRRYVVLALQDIDDRVRQELERSQWDMQMAAILKCRYTVMNTIHMDTGLCERIDLRQAASTRDSQSDNYAQHVERALQTLVCAEDAEAFRQTMSFDHIRQQALDVENYAEEVCQYRTREIPPRWLEQHVIYSRQAGQVMVNILGRDVTSERNREAVRKEKEQEKLDIIRSLSCMFFATYYVDLRDDTFQSVTQLQEAGEFLGERLRYTAGLQVYAEKYIHPDDHAEYLETMSINNLKKRLGVEQPYLALEYRKLPPGRGQDTPPDECGWTRATAVLVQTDEEGRPITILYAAQDVTETKQKEAREHRALQDAYQAANHANAAKSEFLSRMSHDIRTPMNGIMGMTDIAMSHVDDRDRVLDCLKKISISSRHLLSLVNEVLDMSQIESGKIDLAEERFLISEMVRDLAVILRSSIQEKGHELRIYPLEVEHEAVLGDPTRLRQVFVNILGNSVKYTPPGGFLEVMVQEKESREHGYGCYSFIFRDNGIGMDDAFVKRIFEPFSRAHDSRTGAIEGTGLGMTIAQNIVRMMGGDIAVKSRRGVGSQFTVTLFLKQQTEEAEVFTGGGTDLQQVSLQNRRLLLVEDNELNREIACELLQEVGAEIECAENGQEALELFAKNHPGHYDMILMDIQMPVMNGYDAARAIRGLSRPDAAAIPILAMSANAFAEDIAASREAGMNDHITKPLEVARLMECLTHWLGQAAVE